MRRCLLQGEEMLGWGLSLETQHLSMHLRSMGSALHPSKALLGSWWEMQVVHAASLFWERFFSSCFARW